MNICYQKMAGTCLSGGRSCHPWHQAAVLQASHRHLKPHNSLEQYLLFSFMYCKKHEAVASDFKTNKTKTNKDTFFISFRWPLNDEIMKDVYRHLYALHC